MKIRVYHTYYGCDTGCCGHRIEFYPGGESEGCYQEWEWGHRDESETPEEYARGMAEAFLRVHHPECLATIDWSSMEVDVAAISECNL